MKIRLVLLTLMALSTAVTAQKKQKGKWQNLLSGDKLSAWHTYAEKAWTVKDGILNFNLQKETDGKRGDLITNQDYGNFHLKLEWKVSQNGNSGIMFYVNDKVPYLTGPEMQILDNDGHPDGKLVKHRAGDLYDLIASSKEVAKGYGVWNKTEIISNNGSLEFFLNGVRIVKTTMWDQQWIDMIAGSKFKDIPGFGMLRTGKILLQDHGDEIWFRKILIKTL